MNAVNLTSANNYESIEELMTSLTDDQNKIAADTPVHQPLPRPRKIIPNRQGHKRSTRTAMASELEANYTRRLIYDIILRYFISPVTSYTISNRLYDLGPNEAITLNSLIGISPSHNRPDKSSYLQITEELTASNLFLINNPRRNAINIRKNINYQQ